MLTAMLWFTKSNALVKSVITIVDTVCGLSALLCKVNKVVGSGDTLSVAKLLLVDSLTMSPNTHQ